MRSLVVPFLCAALSACIAPGESATRPPEAQSEAQSEITQSTCEDAWECWCNTFSTNSSCSSAVKGGWHCWWEGTAAAAASVTTSSLAACHATYE